MARIASDEEPRTWLPREERVRLNTRRLDALMRVPQTAQVREMIKAILPALTRDSVEQ